MISHKTHLSFVVFFLDCQDVENVSECKELAASGDCRTNIVEMKEKCFRSCGYCREADIREILRRLETTTKPFGKKAGMRFYIPECNMVHRMPSISYE